MTQPEGSRKQIEMEAAEWVVRLADRPLDRDERRALDAWLARSPAHRAALAEARQTWTELAPAAPPASAEASDTAQADRAAAPDPGGMRRVSRRWAAAAALAACVALAAAVGWLGLGDPVTAWQADYRTGVGEVRSVRLPDGSTVTLDTDTAIDLRFGAELRSVTLLSGEAVFQVTPDPDGRPFVVHAGDSRTRALGTRFLVQRTPAGAEVVVLAHSVRVSADADAADGQQAVTLSAPGEAVAYRAGRGLGPVRRVDPVRAAAWTEGRVVFDDVPLAQVAAELSRYRWGRIVVLDAMLARRRVSGVFRIADIDGVTPVIARELEARTADIPPFVTAIY